jgi:hypothetical protein
MTKVLITSRMDYADEFDVHGFIVLDKEKFDYYDARAKMYFETSGAEINCSFGTNESVVLDSYYKWESGLTVTDISDVEAEVLLKLFGKWGFGPTFITEPSEQLDLEDD